MMNGGNMADEFKMDEQFVAAALGLTTSDEELVQESCGPFGDYYVPRSKINRSRELRVALEALKDVE
jgi:hypothetical protein